jgi:hypothetical protein
MRRTLVIVSGIVLHTGLALGQVGPATVQVDARDIGFDVSTTPLSIGPGGMVRITGTAVYSPDGTVWDAATESTLTGERHDGGLVDAEASGLVLGERDPGTHTYTYVPSGSSSAVCDSLGLGTPCLVLRLPALAAAHRRDLGELREDLSGGLHVEVHVPVTPPAVYVPTYPPPPPPDTYPPVVYEPERSSWFWVAAAGVSGGGLVLSIAVLIVMARRRRTRNTPVSRVQAAAKRLERRIAGDPVKSRLSRVVKDLGAEAASLERLERRLGEAVRNANIEGLEKRRRDLERAAAALTDRGGEEAGQGELKDAVTIIEGQIDRCRKWEMQRWRSAARTERIATRLEALEIELSDPTQNKLGDSDPLLDKLQEELELARAGEREAETLLGGGTPDSGAEAA